MNVIKEAAWKCLAPWLKDRIYPPFAARSYSQEGEDRVVERIVNEWRKSTPGFYVDVGAYHPQLYSNTYAFYLNGWKGINIDARPGAMELFGRLRPNDINLEVAVSDLKQTLTYYEFDDPALNSFCPEWGPEHPTYRVIGTRQLTTVTLAEVLDQHVPEGQVIDFLSIDVEGMDDRVLRSNDWTRFRPKLVLAEDACFPGFDRAMDSSVTAVLAQHGYQLCSRLKNTLIFLRTDL